MSREPFIAVVTGMRAEARIASGMAGVRTIVAGTNTSRLHEQIERAITEAATLRLEYRYIDYGTSKFADVAANTQDKISVHDNGLRMGISFRF